MKLRRIDLALVLWCVLVIAPACGVQLGVFGAVDANTPIHGGVIGLWLVGYLAQLAAFMWVVRLAGEQRIVWWLVASLLPWLFDWTLPVSAAYGLAWFPLLIAVTSWIGWFSHRRTAILESGLRATGVVLEVVRPAMNVVVNNVYIRRTLRLRIERDDKTAAYEGKLTTLFPIGSVPSVGDKIPLMVHRSRPQWFEPDPAAKRR